MTNDGAITSQSFPRKSGRDTDCYFVARLLSQRCKDTKMVVDSCASQESKSDIKRSLRALEHRLRELRRGNVPIQNELRTLRKSCAPTTSMSMTHETFIAAQESAAAASLGTFKPLQMEPLSTASQVLQDFERTRVSLKKSSYKMAYAWHGTSLSNFDSIAEHGLLIPAPVLRKRPKRTDGKPAIGVRHGQVSLGFV